MNNRFINKINKKSYIITIAIIIIVILSLILAYFFQNSKSSIDKSINFAEAKKILSVMYSNTPRTFYIDCGYNPKTKQIIKENCNFMGNYEKIYITWEHIFPVSRFGKTFECWNGKYNKRNYCEKNDPEFRKIISDMHNIVPTINVLTTVRSNFDMNEIDNLYKRNEYGGMKVDEIGRQIEPIDEFKGESARAYLYMSTQYNLHLKPEEIAMFNKWSELDPPTSFECNKNKFVFDIQKTNNDFISNKCK